MTGGLTSSGCSVVIGARFAVALCAKEPGRYDPAKKYLAGHALAGSQLFAPGVILAEVLFAFCRQQEEGRLTPAEYAQAVTNFNSFMSTVLPPAGGDKSLVLRAEQADGTVPLVDDGRIHEVRVVMG